MPKEILDTLRHIFDACIDNANTVEEFAAWTSARDIVEYTIAGNLDTLKEFDYLETLEERLERINE